MPDLRQQPATNSDRLLTDAESLCRTVAGRDLADLPLYILWQSAIADEFGTADECDGYTTPSLDLYLKDDIGSAWRGRGPCMVINDLVLKAEMHPDDFEYVVLAAVLHELAHILDRPAAFADRTGVQPELLQFERLVVASVSKRPVRTDIPAYHGHGDSFIRIALHLRRRAGLAGVRIAPALLCAGFGYGLSHATRYERALGDEPKRMADALFRDIRAADPPPAFSQLWNDDMSAYHQRFSVQEGESA